MFNTIMWLSLVSLVVVLCLSDCSSANKVAHKVGSRRSGILDTSEWTYAKPSQWPGFCEDANSVQSPIHIHPQYHNCDNTAEGLNFSPAFHHSRKFLVHNTGHSVSFDVPAGEDGLHVVRKKNNEPYKVDSFHLHWGGPESVKKGLGSEHRIGNEPTVLEVHIVTHDSKFPSLDKAKAHLGDTLVVGILYKIGGHNDHMEKILNLVDKVRAVNASITGHLKLGDLLPGHHKFYIYPGSFTTPNCEISVAWHVFKQIEHISHAQMERFRHVVGENFNSNVGNFRPVQAARGRPLVCNP